MHLIKTNNIKLKDTQVTCKKQTDIKLERILNFAIGRDFVSISDGFDSVPIFFTTTLSFEITSQTKMILNVNVLRLLMIHEVLGQINRVLVVTKHCNRTLEKRHLYYKNLFYPRG